MTLPVVALTGATGFIGKRILRALVEGGYDVRVLARRIPAEIQLGVTLEGVTWLKGGLTDRAVLKDFIAGASAVVHCAGCTKARDRTEFFAVNAGATQALADIAARQETPPRFILVSSLAAREPRLSSYAASKRAGEQALRQHKAKLPTVILRPPAVYGPGDPETLRIFQMAARGFIPAPMVPNARASLVHVDDVAGAVMAALALDLYALPDQPIEFDDGGAYTWADIAAAAGAAVRTNPRLILIPAAALYIAGALASLHAALTQRPTVLSWGKIPELLHPDWVASPITFPGYKPLWNIDKGFKDAVSWYTSQGLLTS